MILWRVLEQNRHNCTAIRDSDYNKITEFTNEDKAIITTHLYLIVTIGLY